MFNVQQYGAKNAQQDVTGTQHTTAALHIYLLHKEVEREEESTALPEGKMRRNGDRGQQAIWLPAICYIITHSEL